MAQIDGGGGGGGGELTSTSGGDGSTFLDMAKGVSPDEASRRSVAAVILALGSGFALIADTILGGIANLGTVFIEIRNFLASLFVGPQNIVLTSAEASAVASAEFGIFSFIVGVGIIIGAFLLWDRSNVELPVLDRINFRGRD